MKNIYCKSSISINQLEARKCLDKTGIELQLLADFVEKPKTTDEYITNMGEYVKDISVVHVPLKSGEEIVEVQMLSETKYTEIFNRICDLTQRIAEINKKDIIIVIHNAWSLNQYECSNDKFVSIVRYLKETLEKYPNIKIAIENVIPYAPKGKVEFRNGSYPNYVEVVKRLRSDINTDRIGTVLDTCHAMVTIKIDSVIKSFGECGKEIMIEEYYKVNKDICMLVHLCNVKKLGYNKGQHGVAFEKEDKELLKQLMIFHKKYIENADITIEVLEKDYTNCKNYSKTKELYDEIMGEGI